MPNDLMQIVYTSNGTRNFSDANLADMLINFRSSNEKNGISGLLIYYKQSFLQVFEGPAAAVEQLWVNIRSDPRHVLVNKLHYRSIEQRMFGKWSMAYDNFSNAEDVFVDGFIKLLDIDNRADKVPESEVQFLIKAFSERL